MAVMKKIEAFFAYLFKDIEGFIGAAYRAANKSGLTEQAFAIALVWVRVAMEKFADNSQRREFVVEILVNRGIPESIARLAVELAVQWIKKNPQVIQS